MGLCYKHIHGDMFVCVYVCMYVKCEFLFDVLLNVIHIHIYKLLLADFNVQAVLTLHGR